ncbi:protein of unknown function [Pseudorhizobium banfieldiae]|uniref:Uncharacterized protein n=1 Tax=Pseudorhizobium banfieldiae TaxID=1125847 RepID=L0NCR3_9HYPH|nr:protein of unknown function [Pseudorhizobium banfieldiae]
MPACCSVLTEPVVSGQSAKLELWVAAIKAIVAGIKTIIFMAHPPLPIDEHRWRSLCSLLTADHSDLGSVRATFRSVADRCVAGAEALLGAPA